MITIFHNQNRINFINSILSVLFSLFLFGTVPAYSLDCKQDILTNNSDGEMLQTLSGDIYQTLDSITAYLWLPASELLICGPQYFEYKGNLYQIYDITNINDGQNVSALAIINAQNSLSQTNDCYQSTITNPTPFMGNNDEIFVLADGSIWKILYEYEYMYKYYPSVTACPSEGYVIVEGEKLKAQKLK